MTTDSIRALRADLFAPIASFRDPMFPGVTRCLPVPPPSTLRGMLTAATGLDESHLPLALTAHADGGGEDTETYHPIAADGTNAAVAGRTAAVKGGMTIRQRPFLASVHVTVWVLEPDAHKIAAALHRPVWGLHLGRSQDSVYVRDLRMVELRLGSEAVVGHALAPPGGHDDVSAVVLRMSGSAGQDRLGGDFTDYLWCPEPGGRQPVSGALLDGDQALWFHGPAAG